MGRRFVFAAGAKTSARKKLSAERSGRAFQTIRSELDGAGQRQPLQSEDESQRRFRRVLRTISQPPRVAGRCHGQSARESGYSWRPARGHACEYIADSSPGAWCAAASGMEGQAEALRDLLFTYHGVQERDPSETSWPHPGHREIAYDLRSRLTRNCRIREMPPVNGMKSRFFISVERCSILSWIASASVCFATTTAVTYLMKLTPHFSQLPPERCWCRHAGHS